MSTSSTSGETPQQPTTPERPERTANHWARMRMAHEAMMLADAGAVLEQDRAFTRAHREQMMGAELKGDDVGDIRIGDELHYHQTPAPPASGGGSSLAKAGLLALGLAAGGIPGTVAAYLASRPQPQPPAAMPTVTNPPTITAAPDRDWGLSLLPPD